MIEQQMTLEQAEKIDRALTALLQHILDFTCAGKNAPGDDWFDLSLILNCLGALIASRMIALAQTQGRDALKFHAKILSELMEGYRHRLDTEALTDSQIEALMKAGPTVQ